MFNTGCEWKGGQKRKLLTCETSHLFEEAVIPSSPPISAEWNSDLCKTCTFYKH